MPFANSLLRFEQQWRDAEIALASQLIRELEGESGSPLLFAERSLHFTPDAWQRDLLTSTAPRILLNCSRQSGKSTCSAILALHRALFVPESLILLISPSLRQSSELMKKVFDFLRYVEPLPVLHEENKLSLEFENHSRIVSLPGSEATIRGFSGVSLIIEDESARCLDSLYLAVKPMLAVSGGSILLMSTPWGQRGHFYQEWSSGEEWQRFEVRADQCPRITAAFLAQERRDMPENWYLAEYMCQFTETEDSLFRYSDIMNALTDDGSPLFAEELTESEPDDLARFLLPE
jgi:Terminase large subunit, T4likevirus-type, N-terminal